MTATLRLALAQLNMLVGDIDGNTDKAIAATLFARDELRADAILFPELALSGYPPEDLLQRPAFGHQIDQALQRLRDAAHGITIFIGHPQRVHDALFNVATVLRDGAVIASYRKQLLPNYSVFDEKRYFTAGHASCVVPVAGVGVGIAICEDVWEPAPVRMAVEGGAQLVLVLNASPYHVGKGRERQAVVAARATEHHVPLVYLNLVGGQDELVFDGESFIIAADGRITQQLPAFTETIDVADFTVDEDGRVQPLPRPLPAPLTEEASVYQALVLGIRDYVDKNRFEGVVIGLSGGIDSALTLALAVDALGCGRVEAVMMPSRYTADISRHDARAEAEAVGVAYREISIEPPFQAFIGQLADEFRGLAPDTTEENIQARCRGVMLMAISNKKRRIVLTTGNKSEMAVGYATLYGDMAGGFAPIKDVAKTLVYRLASYRNGINPVIPPRVIERPPSAELAPDQKDEDSLPPYAILDPILEQYIELDRSPDDIIEQGFDAATVLQVVGLVNRNEYKRRQAPPGVRITRRAFGRDRRYPITSGYSDNHRLQRRRAADQTQRGSHEKD